MEILMQILPVTLYILGIVLLIVLIVLGIKLIETIDRANNLISDLEKKTKSLNGFFSIIDNVTDTISFLSDTVVETVISSLSKVFKKNKKKEIKENE